MGFLGNSIDHFLFPAIIGTWSPLVPSWYFCVHPFPPLCLISVLLVRHITIFDTAEISCGQNSSRFSLFPINFSCNYKINHVVRNNVSESENMLGQRRYRETWEQERLWQGLVIDIIYLIQSPQYIKEGIWFFSPFTSFQKRELTAMAECILSIITHESLSGKTPGVRGKKSVAAACMMKM